MPWRGTSPPLNPNPTSTTICLFDTWHSQVAVVVQGLADLFGHRLIHLHDRCLVPAAVAVVGGTEDRAYSLNEAGKTNAKRKSQQAHHPRSGQSSATTAHNVTRAGYPTNPNGTARNDNAWIDPNKTEGRPACENNTSHVEKKQKKSCRKQAATPTENSAQLKQHRGSNCAQPGST